MDQISISICGLAIVHLYIPSLRSILTQLLLCVPGHRIGQMEPVLLRKQTRRLQSLEQITKVPRGSSESSGQYVLLTWCLGKQLPCWPVVGGEEKLYQGSEKAL